METNHRLLLLRFYLSLSDKSHNTGATATQAPMDLIKFSNFFLESDGLCSEYSV